MKYKAVIFDLDGTLLNTIEDLKNATNHALTAFGYPARTTEEMKHFAGRGVRYMMAKALPGGEDNPQFEDVFNCFRPYYEAHCMDLTAPYPGIGDLLARLRQAGCKTAVVTNKIQSAADELIHDLFPDIPLVIGDSPAVKRKPAPDGVWLALEKLGVDRADAAYVGDSNIDYETAKNAALPCLSVLWGFRTREELVACGADTFFETPEALADYLLA